MGQSPAVKTVQLLCPNCRSPEFETLGDPNRARCRHCAAVFAITSAVPAGGMRGAAYGTAPTRGPVARSGAGVVIIAGAATLLLLAGVAGFGVMRGKAKAERRGQLYTYKSSAPQRSADVTPPPVVAQDVEPEKLPMAEVKASTHGVTFGYEVWVGEIANTGEVPLDHPCVRVMLKDGSGATLADHRGYSPRAALGPKETAPFRISAKQSQYAKAELALCDLRPVTYGAGEAPAVVVEHRHQRDQFSQAVIGTVENQQSTVLKFVKIVVMGRDASGKLVSVDEGYADVREMKPGSKSTFKVGVGVLAAGTATRYEVFAVGMPG